MAWTLTNELQAARMRLRNLDRQLAAARKLPVYKGASILAALWNQASQDRALLKHPIVREDWRRRNHVRSTAK
jgi:hypothetical protein